MVLLLIFQRLSESTPLLLVVALLQVGAVWIVNQKTTYLTETFGGNENPDLWFGIEAKRLYNYFAGIGADGRRAYLDLAHWDVLAMMPSYTMLLGSLLYRECQKANLSTKLSLIIIITVISDGIETIGCGYVIKTFPKPLKKEHMNLVSNANVVKWITLVSTLIFLGLLFAKNLIFSKPPSVTETQESKTKKES